MISLLNGFGHCVSHSVTLNHDTALANQEVRRGVDALPLSIQPRIPTIIVWDNNDFGEETLSGHGTTHNTNGIVIQHGNTTASTTDLPNASTTDPPNASTTDPPNASTTDPPNTFTTDVLEKRTRKRSLEPPLANLATYYGGKNEGPAPFAAGISLEQSTYAMLLKNPEKLDLAYHVTKFNVDRFLPSWTGYNQLLAQVEVPPGSVIGYLLR